jgi:riboflavin kinase/FMN adenylyltransferase
MAWLLDCPVKPGNDIFDVGSSTRSGRGMDIIRGWRDVPAVARGAVLAIGNFDGVHRGHQAVLGRARELGRARGKRSGALIFEPHPREFFAPQAPFFRLTPLPVKLELLAALGLDQTIVVDFDPDLSSLSADQFAAEVLGQGLGVSGVIVGYDFTYGKGRTGSPLALAESGARSGFEVDVVEPVSFSGEIFSSSQVREHLKQGAVDEAASQLGYWWRVRGRVEHGAGRGKGLGFPTINLPLDRGQEVGHGIYAVRVLHAGRRYPAAGYIGSRPTFGGGVPAIEATLLDFDGNLYGEEVEIEFIAKIRGDAVFAGPEDLAAQMEADCEEARTILREIERHDPMNVFPLGRALSEETEPATGL